MTCAKKGCANEAVGGDNKYCATCRAAYMREWRATRKTLEGRTYFYRGAEAMRAAIIKHFREVGDRDMNGLTAARIAELIEVSRI